MKYVRRKLVCPFCHEAIYERAVEGCRMVVAVNLGKHVNKAHGKYCTNRVCQEADRLAKEGGNSA